MILQLYHKSDMLEEKNRIARAMGAIKDEKLLQKVLDFSISDAVRSQDSVFVIISVGMSKTGRDLAWNFFKENKDLFKTRYPVSFKVSLEFVFLTPITESD